MESRIRHVLYDPNRKPDDSKPDNNTPAVSSYEAREDGLTDEEYKQASALCRVFVDENRAAAKRGKK